MSDCPSEEAELNSARLRVPEHVVYRDFGDDTVILNLQSGNYHGLNRTAALMVATLGDAASVGDAVDRVVAATGQPREVIERDLHGLCSHLIERGLLERDAGDAG